MPPMYSSNHLAMFLDKPFRAAPSEPMMPGGLIQWSQDTVKVSELMATLTSPGVMLGKLSLTFPPVASFLVVICLGLPKVHTPATWNDCSAAQRLLKRASVIPNCLPGRDA
jgi:hypothetical protein